jgi:hypothetical protein
MRRVSALVCAFALFLPTNLFAWGDKGHRIVNRLAWQHLPADMPAFLRGPACGNEIEYLGPEPDRWRSPLEPELASTQGPEHYIDLELADRLGELPRQRWQFVQQVYAYRAAHPAQAAEMLPEEIGLLPWEMTEVEQRLQTAFRAWREAKSEHRDTSAIEETVLFYMGWLGHYVADGSQPLHTTVQFNGWHGPNPNGYATGHKIHAQFETDFMNKNIDDRDVQPFIHTPTLLMDVFAGDLAYLRTTNQYVEQTYRLEKAGGFAGNGTAEARRFTAQRLAAAVTMLDSLWLTAWRNSAVPAPERGAPAANSSPK